VNVAELVYRSVRLHAGRVAIVHGTKQLTYLELWRTTSELVSTLSAHGVAHGDRVVHYADNSPETFALYIACARVGAIFAPVHPDYQTMEIDYVLHNSQPKVVFADDTGLRVLDSLGSQVSGQRILRLHAIEMAGHGGPLERPERLPTIAFMDMPADAPALLTYTSGGMSPTPTPVLRSHAAEICSAESHAQIWDIDPSDALLTPVPLSWTYGLSMSGLAALSVGAAVVILSVRDQEPLVPVIERNNVTIITGNMAMYSCLVGELQVARETPSRLRSLFIGGESVVLPLARLVEHYTGIRPRQAYSATEVTPVLASYPGSDVDAPEDTAGRVVPGSQIRLVDPDGNDVPEGEVGEAWYRGNGMMLGYWREEELTASRVTRDGWFRSGDHMRRDSEGFYFLVGRNHNTIFRGGSKVAVPEVEAAISSLHGVADVVLVPVPDREFGEALIAFVVATPGHDLSIDMLYDELSSKIARYKIPREIYVLKEFPDDLKTASSQDQMRAFADSGGDGIVVTMADWLERRSREPSA
jgi:long-chain acyl-CoA synthetase